MEFWKGNSIYGKTMEFEQNGRTYGKTGNFRFGGKKCVLSLKNGEKIRPDFNVCCFGYHFTRPSTTNLPGYTASLSRVNTCWAVNIVRPLSLLRQQVLMSYWLRRWLFSYSRSRPVTVTLSEATQGPSTGNWLSQSVPLLSPPTTISLSLSAQVQGYLFGFVDFVIVLILPHLPRWVRDRDSTESLAFYLFVLSTSPPRALPLLAWSGDMLFHVNDPA